MVNDWNSNIQINAGHAFLAADVPLLAAGGAPGSHVPEPSSPALLLPALGIAAIPAKRRRTGLNSRVSR